MALAMITQAGPVLLDAMESAISVDVRDRVVSAKHPRVGKALTKNSQLQVKAKTLDPLIREWPWEEANADKDGVDAFHVSFHGKGGVFVEWPPDTFYKALNLLGLLQACHMWILALSTATRHGELIELQEGSLSRVDESHSKVRFRTWKYEAPGGAKRDVPVPAVVEMAVSQQERLAALMKRLGGVSGQHIWVQMGAKIGLPLNSFSRSLSLFNLSFGLGGVLGEEPAHMHRFRKSLVRIVALSLVHAPKVLMDVLGHKDEYTTIFKYILSSPMLLSEIEQTTRELVVLRAIETVRNSDKVQGSGARLHKQRVQEYCTRLGEAAWEPQNLLEFAEAMTERGTGWAVIAPGVICTGFLTGGLCRKGSGKANPHYCNANCSKQLVLDEEAPHNELLGTAERVIGAIEFLLDSIKKAQASCDQMLCEQFAGQVRALLGRWKDVDEHFRKCSIVQGIVRGNLKFK